MTQEVTRQETSVLEPLT